MQQVRIEDLSHGDLVNLVVRDQQVKQEMARRNAALWAENAELSVIVQAQGQELTQARQLMAEVVSANGDEPSVEPVPTGE
jgi:hypothetical protein